MAGLGDKYRVVRIEDQSPVDDAFVLRVTKDPVGWLAAWHYANLTRNDALANDLRNWLIRHTPSEASLGSEGRLNREALASIEEVLASARQSSSG